MAFAVISLIALGIIIAALAVAWSRRFLAYGAIALANIIVHALMAFGPSKVCTIQGREVVRQAIHCDLALHGEKLAGFEPVAFLQLVTSMFVHADIFHIFGNLLILLAFSIHFEDRIGHRAFVGIYLLSGLAAALFQSATAWGDISLMMGASGAVFGIIGAFAGAYPNLVVPLPLPLIVFMIWVRMRVWVAAAVFAGTQIITQQLSRYDPGNNVAYFAHLGGLAAGLVIAYAYVRTRRETVAPRNPVPVSRLQPFANNTSARNALANMESNLDERSIFQAWQERFFRHATCPTCAKHVHPANASEVACEQGHTFNLREAA